MNNFNSAVGLEGQARSSNFLGAAAIGGSLLLGGRSGVTTSVAPQFTVAAGTDKLTALQSERTKLQQLIQTCKENIARLDAERGGCKRTIGWNNGCLDANSAASKAESDKVIVYESRIAQINAEIPKIQAEIKAKQDQEAIAAAAAAANAKAAAEAEAIRLKAESEKITAQAQANPANAQIAASAEIAKAQAAASATVATNQATIAASADKSKTMMLIGAAVVALVIVAGAVMFIFKQ